MSLGPQNRNATGERPRRPPRPVVVRRRIMVFGIVPGAIGLFIFGIVVSLSGGPAVAPPPAASTTTTTQPVRTQVSTTIGVGVRTVTYVDKSRKTFNYTTGKTTRHRKITVEVRYETGSGKSGTETPNAPVLAGPPRPVIVFAPGYRHRAEDYEALLDDWVNAGYVVVAVAFPDTTYPASDVPYQAGLPHGSPEADLYNEPGDVAYVLSQLASSSAAPANWLHGLINVNEVFLAGHSDGGTAVAALVYDAAAQVSGVTLKGTAVLSGAELPIAGQTYSQPSTAVPLLVVQSATDTCNAPAAAITLYDAVGAPKYFLELLNASHINSYNGADPAATAAVAAVTGAFFALDLGQKGATVAGLNTLATRSGVSSFSSTASVPTLPTPSGSPSCPSD